MRLTLAVGAAWLLMRLGGVVLVVADATRIAGRHGPHASELALVLWRLSWSVRGAGFMATYAFLAAAVLVVVAVVAARPPRLSAAAFGLSPSGLSPPGLVAVLAGAVGLVTAVEACLSTLGGSGRFVAFERMQAIRDADWQSYVWLLIALPLVAAAVELILRGIGQAASPGKRSGLRLVGLALLTPLLAPEPFHGLATIALAAYLGWITDRVRGAGPAIGAHALASGVAVLAVEAYPGAVPMSARVLLFLGGAAAAFVGAEVVRRATSEVAT